MTRLLRSFMIIPIFLIRSQDFSHDQKVRWHAISLKERLAKGFVQGLIYLQACGHLRQKLSVDPLWNQNDISVSIPSQANEFKTLRSMCGRLLKGEYGLETTLFHGINLTQLEGSHASLLQQTQAKIPQNKKVGSVAFFISLIVAALEMLGTITTGMAIDANSPICDNVGCITKMAISHRIRERTDVVDAAGNTTTGLGNMLAIQAKEGEGSGHPSEPQPPPSPAQPTNEEPIPNVVSSSHQKTQTPRQALNQVTELSQTSEPIPNVPDESVYKEWDDRVERATTTAASLDVEQASGGSPRCQEAMEGSIAQTRSERVPTLPRDSPLPRVNTLGSDDGSMTLQELTILCITLSKKVESLEADLKQTKQVYDDEEALKDSSKQGRMIEEINQDAGVTLVTPTQGEDHPEDQLGVLSAAKILADAAKTNVHTFTRRRRRAVSTSSGGISTASRLFSTAEESVSTAGTSMPVSTAGMVQEANISIPSPVVIKDKGKGKMKESKDEQIKRTKLLQEQDRLGHEATMRLQEELDEEERQRMARVHDAA
ncbi:ribonuclease H-like domain-containing protein [Tanacetum coccineum]